MKKLKDFEFSKEYQTFVGKFGAEIIFIIPDKIPYMVVNEIKKTITLFDKFEVSIVEYNEASKKYDRFMQERMRR